MVFENQSDMIAEQIEEIKDKGEAERTPGFWAWQNGDLYSKDRVTQLFRMRYPRIEIVLKRYPRLKKWWESPNDIFELWQHIGPIGANDDHLRKVNVQMYVK